MNNGISTSLFEDVEEFMKKQFSILVVDDEIINLENIRHYLIRQGYSSKLQKTVMSQWNG